MEPVVLVLLVFGSIGFILNTQHRPLYTLSIRNVGKDMVVLLIFTEPPKTLPIQFLMVLCSHGDKKTKNSMEKVLGVPKSMFIWLKP